MKYTDPWKIPQPETTDEPNGAVQMSEIGDVVNAALSVANGDTAPRAYGAQNTETLSSDSDTLMPFPTMYYDYGGMYDTSTRLFTIPEDGIYDVKFLARWATSSVASRRMLYVAATFDGSTSKYAIDSRIGMSASFYQTTADTIPAYAGTTLAFYAYQDSGSTMTILGYHASITKFGTIPAAATRVRGLEPTYDNG